MPIQKMYPTNGTLLNKRDIVGGEGPGVGKEKILKRYIFILRVSWNSTPCRMIDQCYSHGVVVDCCR